MSKKVIEFDDRLEKAEQATGKWCAIRLCWRGEVWWYNGSRFTTNECERTEYQTRLLAEADYEKASKAVVPEVVGLVSI